jgi:hypothetical protein
MALSMCNRPDGQEAIGFPVSLRRAVNKETVVGDRR